jgi:hypothetical protein
MRFVCLLLVSRMMHTPRLAVRILSAMPSCSISFAAMMPLTPVREYPKKRILAGGRPQRSPRRDCIISLFKRLEWAFSFTPPKFRTSRGHLCDFCNDRYFFSLSHIARRIFWSPVTQRQHTWGGWMKPGLSASMDAMKRHIPTRMALFVMAIFTISLAAVSVTVRASRAADDCLTQPNAAAPQGSHWYYRVDRTTHRECWYLGAEGGKVRQHVRQDASPVLSQPSKMSTQPAPQIPAKVTNAEVGAAEATRTATAPVESTSGQAKPPEDNSIATLSARWSDTATSTLSIDRRSVSMKDSCPEEKATTESKDEMPSISPILTPAKLAEQPPEIPTSLARLGAVFAAVLGSPQWSAE